MLTKDDNFLVRYLNNLCYGVGELLSGPILHKLIKNRPHKQLQCIRTIKRGCGSHIFDLHMLICTCIILHIPICLQSMWQNLCFLPRSYNKVWPNILFSSNMLVYELYFFLHTLQLSMHKDLYNSIDRSAIIP